MKRSLHATALSLASPVRTLPTCGSEQDMLKGINATHTWVPVSASFRKASTDLRILFAAALLLCVAVNAIGQAPSDLCVNSGAANQFPVGATCTPITFNKPNTFAANLTPAGGTCNSGAFGDAFGWFQATSTLTTITYAPTAQDAILHVFSGTCAAPVQVACVDAGLAGVAETVTFATTIGTSYFFRVQRWNSNAALNGTICVFNAPPPPSNDNPCGATALTVGTTCTYVNSTNLNATATTGIPAPGCAAYNGGDVWFSVVVPASGRIIFDSNTGGITDGGMALYTTAPNTCSGTFTLVECDDDDSVNGFMPYIDRSGLTPGSTVWIRFWELNNDANGTFQICAYAPTPPANDDPCAATVLPVGTSCTPLASTTTFASGTTGPPAPTCANYVGGDVWFRLTVPASGSVIIETFANVITDGGMAVYTSPSCTGPFTQEYCDDDGGTGLMPYLSMTGLAPGSTIWVRFWEFGNDNPGTFSICARTPPPPPAGDCVYVLNLFDSFGDGWGSSNVGVRINGGAWTYYTVGGSTNQVLLGMMIGDFIELTYDASGPFQGENSYSLGLLGGGTFFNSGSTPAAGPSFGQLVDCVPPPAAPQDCNGGATICNGQAFNNNSSNTGNVVDLNTANQGCLGGGEQQGTWYYFSPSSAGTIGFTIAPVVATDYDFAVWGPMTSVTCPPPGPPLRCSFAAPAGNTGLGNGATDPSEGAGGDRWVSTINVLAGQIYILYVDNFSTNGQAFNLTWQLSSGASLDCSVLPVELVNLKAEQQLHAVALTWTTLSESVSDHFLIERSVDGLRFEPLAVLEAAGRSSTPIDYALRDDTPVVGDNQYRVTLIDVDGTALVSNVVTAHYRPLGTGIVVVPNPAKDIIHVNMAPAKTAGSVLLLDATGRFVQQLAFNEGVTSVQLAISELDLGVYTILLNDLSGRRLDAASFVKE